MDIKKIVSNVLLEAVKKKDLPPLVAQKLADAYPSFNGLTDEQKMADVMQIINRHDVLKSSFNEDNPTYYNFILQHDGRNPRLEKVDPKTLPDITQAPIKSLIKLLHAMGAEKFPDLNLEKAGTGTDDGATKEEVEKMRLDGVFNENGYLPTDSKIESSKEMWYSDKNAIINDNGFRVYAVMNEEQADRMGYYYEALFIQQIKKLRQDNPNGDWAKVVEAKQAPWCHIWRGSAYRGYTVKDPDTGQVLYDHSPSKYGDRRENFGYTLFEVIDESINPLDEIATKGQFHMATIIVKPNGGFMVSPMLNAGEISKVWAGLVQLYPKLDGHKDLLVPREFDPKEMMPRKAGDNQKERVNEKEGHPREFAGLDPDEQVKFIKEGGEIQKIRSWKAMTPAVRKIYIQSINNSNYTTKINNFELLKAIKNTQGFAAKLDSKLKEIGVQNGIAKLVNDYITTDFVLEYMGKKDSNVNVYSSKSSKKFCVYDANLTDFVIKDNTTYDDRFDRGKNIRLKNKNGNLYLVYSFNSPNGDEFFILNDDFANDQHKGYIMSKKGFGIISEDLQLKPEDFEFKPDDNLDLIGEENM
jgi:hypothetical protein